MRALIDGHNYGRCLCLCLRFYFGGCGQQKMPFVSIIIRILIGPEGLLSRASKKKYNRGCIQEIFFALPVIIYNRYNIIMIVDIFFLK